MRILGVDFTSRPDRRKPIVAAIGEIERERLRISDLLLLDAFPKFEALLQAVGPWVGGFDFPFGLPRRFVDAQMPADDWPTLIARVAALDRAAFCQATCGAFYAAKGIPELKHRVVDVRAGSHSPLKTMDLERGFALNPPVGLMLYEGAPRLLAAGVDLPGLREDGDSRIALEAYPGWVARGFGERLYKNDATHHGTSRRDARRRLLARLGTEDISGFQADVDPGMARRITDDPGGDLLDAVLCAAQAAWGARRADSRYGLPSAIDPVEGWVVGVPG